MNLWKLNEFLEFPLYDADMERSAKTTDVANYIQNGLRMLHSSVLFSETITSKSKFKTLEETSICLN